MCKFDKKTINLPSFISFVASKANKYFIKNQNFFIEFQSEISKISDDQHWNSSSDLMDFKDFIMST